MGNGTGQQGQSQSGQPQLSQLPQPSQQPNPDNLQQGNQKQATQTLMTAGQQPLAAAQAQNSGQDRGSNALSSTFGDPTPFNGSMLMAQLSTRNPAQNSLVSPQVKLGG